MLIGNGHRRRRSWTAGPRMACGIVASCGGILQLQHCRCGERNQLLSVKCAELLSSHCPTAHTGLAFLLVFYAWGLLYLRPESAPATKQARQSILGLVSAGATALLVGQIVVQAIYQAGDASWATDEHTKSVLQIFGLNRADSAGCLALVSITAQMLTAQVLDFGRLVYDRRSRHIQCCKHLSKLLKFAVDLTQAAAYLQVFAAPAMALLATTRELWKTQSPAANSHDPPFHQTSLQRISMHSTLSYISGLTGAGKP